jgi:type I restriction enzyme R subunit
VEGAVARALTSHQSLAELLLQQDRQTMRPFIEMIYQLVKEGKRIDLDGIGTQQNPQII